LDLNEDSFNKWKEANKVDPSKTLADFISGKKPDNKNVKRWPGEMDPVPLNPD
jgi:hypothetical protein